MALSAEEDELCGGDVVSHCISSVTSGGSGSVTVGWDLGGDLILCLLEVNGLL